MITLFAKTGCQYCTRTIAVLDELGLSFVKKNIANDDVDTELRELGGKRQVPYIVDGDVQMYESEDIMSYLRETYGTEATPYEERSHVKEYEAEASAGVCVPDYK